MIATLLLLSLASLGAPDANDAAAEDAARKEIVQPPPQETVVLLHGMGRTRISLKLLERRLRQAGFKTINFPYSVHGTPLEEIVAAFHAYLREQVETDTYHLVGHSLGNIIVRAGFRQEYRPGLGRIVMLAPPNQPPHLAERLRDNSLYKILAADPGQRLGSREFYATLPTPTVPFGVIAGDRGQRITFDEPNDGIVAVAETRLDGMADHIVLHHAHTFIMNAKDTAEECVHFLRHGRFKPRPGESE